DLAAKTVHRDEGCSGVVHRGIVRIKRVTATGDDIDQRIAVGGAGELIAGGRLIVDRILLEREGTAAVVGRGRNRSDDRGPNAGAGGRIARAYTVLAGVIESDGRKGHRLAASMDRTTNRPSSTLWRHHRSCRRQVRAACHEDCA